MPRKRQPREQWNETRKKVYERDAHICQKCKESVPLFEGHVDHIKSGKNGSNHISNLRWLCKRCHGLRLDHRHAGMRGRLVEQGILPPNWREVVEDF